MASRPGGKPFCIETPACGAGGAACSRRKIHPGVGETERLFRDMAGTVTLGGTSGIQRAIIAALQQPQTT